MKRPNNQPIPIFQQPPLQPQPDIQQPNIFVPRLDLLPPHVQQVLQQLPLHPNINQRQQQIHQLQPMWTLGGMTSKQHQVQQMASLQVQQSVPIAPANQVNINRHLAEMKKLMEKLASMNAEIAQLKTDKDAVTGQLTAQRVAGKKLRDELAEKKEEIKQLKDEREKANLAHAESMKKQKKDLVEKDALIEKLIAGKLAGIKLEDVLVKEDEEIKQLNAEQEKMARELNMKQEECINLAKQLKQCQCHMLKDQLEALEKQCNELKDRLDAQKEIADAQTAENDDGEEDADDTDDNVSVESIKRMFAVQLDEKAKELREKEHGLAKKGS